MNQLIFMNQLTLMVYNYVRRYSSRQSRDNIGYEQPSTVVRSYTTTSTRILVMMRENTPLSCALKKGRLRIVGSASSMRLLQTCRTLNPRLVHFSKTKGRFGDCLIPVSSRILLRTRRTSNCWRRRLRLLTSRVLL